MKDHPVQVRSLSHCNRQTSAFAAGTGVFAFVPDEISSSQWKIYRYPPSLHLSPGVQLGSAAPIVLEVVVVVVVVTLVVMELSSTVEMLILVVIIVDIDIEVDDDVGVNVTVLVGVLVITVLVLVLL